MIASNLKLAAAPRGHTMISRSYRGPSTPRPVATAPGLVAQDDKRHRPPLVPHSQSMAIGPPPLQINENAIAAHTMGNSKPPFLENSP